MNVEPVHPATGDQVAQPLQGRPDQRRTAISVIQELVVGRELVTISGDPLPHGRDLAGNRLGTRLLLRRDPRIGSDLLR